MAFSATDAAFEGFRLVRRNPLAIVAWALLYAVISLASLLATNIAAEPLATWFEAAEALEGVTTPSQAEIMTMLQPMLAVLARMAWLIPLSLAISAILSAAVTRGVLTPQAGGFGYLRAGMDEWRVFVVTLVLGVLASLLIAVSVVLVSVAIGIATVSGAAWGFLVAFVVMLATIALGIWLAVRLSLAVPMTVAEKRYAIFDSFVLTRGRFWPMLGMAIIVGVMAIIISLLASIVILPLVMVSGLQSEALQPGMDWEAFMAAIDIRNPWVIANALAEAVVYALIVGVAYAPFAAAYLGLQDSSAPRAA